MLVRILEIEEKSLKRKPKNCMHLKALHSFLAKSCVGGKSQSIQRITILLSLPSVVVEKTTEIVFLNNAREKVCECSGRE